MFAELVIAWSENDRQLGTVGLKVLQELDVSLSLQIVAHISQNYHQADPFRRQLRGKTLVDWN